MSEVTSVNGKTGAVTLAASDVGAVPTSEVGQPNGVASLNSSGKLPEAQLQSSVVSGSQFWVSILNHGAVSGGDCTAAIKAAQTYAEEQPGNWGVFFPPGEWKWSETIVKTVPWKGVPRKSVLKATAPFTYTGAETLRILSNHFSTVYNGSASPFYLEGIDFTVEGSSGHGNIGLANVSGGEIKDCRLKTEGAGQVDSLIDVFASVKHFKVDGVYAENLAETAHGGCMWIRNLTSKPTELVNSTEDITVTNSYFGQTTGDEGLSVFSAGGMVRNVLIDHCVVEGLASSRSHTHLTSTFLLSEEGAKKNAAIENVTWRACTVKDVNNTLSAGGHLLQIGNEGDNKNTTNVLQNVRSIDCTYVVQTSATLVQVVRSVNPQEFEGGYSGTSITKPYVNAVGSAEAVTALFGFPYVHGGTTVGNIAAACRGCNTVSGGNWEAIEQIFYDCAVVDGFKATIPNKTGTLFYREGTGSSFSTAMYSSGTCTGGKRLLAVTAAVGSTETITLTGVSMATTAESGNVLEAGAAAKVYVRNNVLTGPVELGRTGTAAEKVGNNWYGTPDTILAQGSGIIPTCHVYKNNAESANEEKAGKTQTAERDQQSLEYLLTSGTPVIGLEKIPPYMVVNFIAVYVYAVESIPADREHLFMALLNEEGKQLGITADYTSATNTPMTAINMRGLYLTTPWQNGPNWINVRPLICETVSGGTCISIAGREGKSVMQVPPTLGATGNTGQKAPGELPSTVTVSSAIKRPYFVLG